MSTPWTETLYPYGAPVGIAPGSAITSDLQIAKNNPGVEFIGSESNAIFQEMREVAGDFWFVQNASYAASGSVGQWKQTNAAQASYALVVRSTGNIDRFTAAAGAPNPIVWSAAASVLTGVFVDNTNIGSAGIFASQIIPTSPARATFGGPWGYTFNPGVASQVPLTVAAPSGQTADIFDVNLNTFPVFKVDSTGAGTFTTNTASVTPLTVYQGGSPTADLFVVKTGSKQFWVDSAGRLNTDSTIQSNNTSLSFTFASNAADGTGAQSFTFYNRNPTQTTADFATFFTPLGSRFVIGNTGTPRFGGGNGVSTGDTGTVTNTMLAGSIANGKLANSTISGVALGSNLFSLTPGAHLSGGAYNGSAAIPLTTDATNANTASTIVARDGAGAFSMGALTATTINASSTVTGGSFAMIGSDTGLDLSNGTMITRRASDGHLRLNSQNSVTEVVGALTATTTITGTNHIATAAAASGGAGTVSYGGTTATTVGAAGGASALPATPLGYIIINVAGTAAKIPYYN